VQVCPAPTQVEAAHVPLVPLVITHEVPVQQSAVAVHTPPAGWQTLGGAHRPFAQIVLQHSAEKVHVASSALQTPPSLAEPPSIVTTGGRQAPWTHESGAQQFSAVVHDPPAGVQVGAWHR